MVGQNVAQGRVLGRMSRLSVASDQKEDGMLQGRSVQTYESCETRKKHVRNAIIRTQTSNLKDTQKRKHANANASRARIRIRIPIPIPISPGAT